MSKKTKIIKASEIVSPPRIPSGVFSLDVYLGRGSNKLNGWSIGRMNIIYGNESGSKTTLVLKAIANAQKLCPECYLSLDECKCKNKRKWSILFIDGEGSWTSEWAQAMGVDVNDVDILYPTSVEEMIDVVNEELDNRDIIVMETLAAILSSDDIKTSEDMTKSVAFKARLLDNAAQMWMSRLNSAKKKTTIFIENQLRMSMASSMNPYLPQDELENLPGGKWQRFYATVMVRVFPSKPIVDVPDIADEDGVVISAQDQKDIIGHRYTFEVRKNKVFIKGGKDSFILSAINNPSEGIKVGDVISNKENVADWALKMGIASKVGDRQIKYKDKSFPNLSAFVKHLRKNVEDYNELVVSIVEAYEKRHSATTTIIKEEDNG